MGRTFSAHTLRHAYVTHSPPLRLEGKERKAKVDACDLHPTHKRGSKGSVLYPTHEREHDKTGQRFMCLSEPLWQIPLVKLYCHNQKQNRECKNNNQVYKNRILTISLNTISSEVGEVRKGRDRGDAFSPGWQLIERNENAADED